MLAPIAGAVTDAIACRACTLRLASYICIAETSSMVGHRISGLSSDWCHARFDITGAALRRRSVLPNAVFSLK
jgi:hypothetical protein